MIDWSYDLLDGSEKRLFERLAVFAGGSTAEAAEAVCNADSDLEIEVLDALESLSHKNLLKVQPGADGQPRCLMLQTIREYALDKLERRGESEKIYRAYAGYYGEVANKNLKLLRSAQRQAALIEYDVEYDNARTGLSWSIKNGENKLAGQLAVG